VTFSEFLAMGGYAAYVWPSFGIAVVVMLGVAWASRQTLKSRLAALEALERRRERGAKP
jgi:heme exporter protein D